MKLSKCVSLEEKQGTTYIAVVHTNASFRWTKTQGTLHCVCTCVSIASIDLFAVFLVSRCSQHQRNEGYVHQVGSWLQSDLVDDNTNNNGTTTWITRCGVETGTWPNNNLFIRSPLETVSSCELRGYCMNSKHDAQSFLLLPWVGVVGGRGL